MAMMVLATIGAAPVAPATKPATGPAPTPVEKYDLLIGEGLAGAGFVVRHAGVFWGVCSVHQFDGGRPGTLVPLDGDPVQLDPTKSGARQEDVQAIPVAKPAAGLPFLAYEPAFELKAGDVLIVLGPDGKRVTGRLGEKGLKDGRYESKAGPATLELRTDKAMLAAGGSGGPIVLERTGAVVGVLLSADDGEAARVIGFETLCLADADPSATRELTLSEAIRPLRDRLPKSDDWEPEAVMFAADQFGLAYIPLPNAERGPVVKATRQIVGFAGQVGPPKDEAISLTVTEFADAEIAKDLPARMAEGYKRMVGLFRAAGITITDIKVEDVKAVKSDAATVLRASGREGEKPFANTIVRATRGRHMVEYVLRNVEQPDEQIAALVNDALDRAATATITK